MLGHAGNRRQQFIYPHARFCVFLRGWHEVGFRLGTMSFLKRRQIMLSNTRSILSKSSIFLILALFACQGTAQETNAKGEYASINGLKMYYEIHGNGQPLVLLHG